uniref:SpaA isopeptide-forming pilin-related protein n=1 Tax=Vaginimicrobium propionicum TaxID=1871034 RepID=UPI00097081CF|nr:hypothetical protein [Vaginimicrobium propionicum]
MSFASNRSNKQRSRKKSLNLLAPILAVLLLCGVTPAALSHANPDETSPQNTSSATPGPSMTPSVAQTPADPPVDPAPSSSASSDPSASVSPTPSATPTPTPPQSMDITHLLAKNPQLFLDGEKLVAGENGYSVHTNTPYQLQLHFKENPDAQNGQMPSGIDLFYKFPAGFQAYADQKGTFTIETSAGPVEDNTFEVKNNELHVKLANHSALTASQQAEFYVSVDVKFDDDATDIPLSPDNTLKVAISNDPNLSITKTATHDFAAGKVFYTLVVKSIDTNENVEIADQITSEDSVLTLNTDPKSVQVKSNNKKAPKPGAPVFENNGFKLIIPKMTHNEQVTVTYSAFVDYSKIDPAVGGTIEQTKNDAKVVSDQIPAPKETTNNLESKLKIGTITKGAGAAQETAPKSGICEQSWTLDVNKYSKLKVAGNTVKDSIPQEFRDMMKYSGNGIKIVVNKGKQDENGNPIEETREIAWANLNANEYEWSYMLPEDDPANSSYEITYTTQVDVTKQIVPSSVKNDASNKNAITPEGPDEKVTAPSNSLNPPHIFNVEKKALTVDEDEVTWEVAVNVVPQGYDSLVLTDTLPAAKSGDQSFQDKLILDDPETPARYITVEGLLEGESWTFSRDANNPDSGFTITFFKDEGKTTPGLKPNPEKDQDGKPVNRTVKVTFHTANDKKWVEAYRAGDESLYRHTNTVKATANGIDRTATAAATPDPEGIHKTFNAVTFKEIDGVNYPVFNYRLRLEGLDKYKGEAFKITDKFDAKQLKLVDDPKPNVSGEEDLTIEQQNGEITFEMKTAQLPKDSSGNFRSVYYLDYSLIPSSREALDAINKNPKGLNVSNTATWGPVTTKAVDADYVYEPLTKEIAEKPTLSNNYTAKFHIVVNSGGLDIGEGQVFKDDMTNLRLKPETLKVTPENFQYKPVYEDGSLTMNIPNKQKVEITYEAKVIGEDLVNYSNKVNVGPDEATAEGSVAVRLGAIGSALNPGITIHKHDASDLTTKLSGAEFELYRIIDDEAEPVIGKLSEDEAEAAPLRFTTDENGEVTIKGDDARLGWSLLVCDDENTYVYQLREVKSPEGYELLTEPLTFSITKTPTQDNEVYDGEVLYFPNTPKEDEPSPAPSATPGKKGKRLPKTGTSGAMGITIVAVGVGAAFISRRR